MTLLKYVERPIEGSAELTKYIRDKRILSVIQKNNINELRPIQIEAIEKGLFFQKNFLICTPSGSGKTLMGELAIINNIFLGFGKGVYLVPYKALAAEKYSYFIRNYGKLGINTALSIGDFEIKEDELKKADIIVTTYEKLDSLLRNKSESSDWVNKIATVVVDEIHVLGDSHRGFKLESLIIRLLRDVFDVQMVCLSATISNPENLCDWLSQTSSESSENKFYLIKSDKRPVRLEYKIEISKNKDSFIRKKIKECLKEKGQILVFVNTRRSSRKSAQEFSNTTKQFLSETSKKKLEQYAKQLKSLTGSSPELRKLIKNGIAYHNAGLLSKERHIIEKLFNERHVKVICCTTTLAAGVNTPARTVILKDFKKRNLWRGTIENKNEISEKYYELPGSDTGYFIPFSNNQTFQLLGRAGRPGLDLTGEGIILVRNMTEFEWVEDFYFKIDRMKKEYIPKYNPVESSFNKIGALREQVLLQAYNEGHKGGLTLEKIIGFFKKSYFSFNFGDKVKLERYLLLKNLNTETLLHLHAEPKLINKFNKYVTSIKITKMNSNFVLASLAFRKKYLIKFHITEGIICSCGFNSNPGKLKSRHNIRNDYHFCDHIIAFLGKLIQEKQNTVLKYLDDIIPGALKSERIIDFLVREGFIIENETNESKNTKYKSSALGSLTVQLYLKPIDMVYLRAIILGDEIYSQVDLLNSTCKFLQMQGKFRDDAYRISALMWISEESVDSIINNSEKVVAGDFFSLKDELIRVLAYITVVSGFLGKYEISDMAGTLSMRIEHGIKEELLDLVVRISGVGRARGRKLHNAGYISVKDIYDSNPAKLHEKTQINMNVCKSIHKNALKIKKSMLK
ncbi:MAG: DEAD/DEAH box helicase [Promethearchaeota archaeon]